ncbi:MAG: cupin domain-containing protein [Halobacteriota archaeon]
MSDHDRPTTARTGVLADGGYIYDVATLDDDSDDTTESNSSFIEGARMEVGLIRGPAGADVALQTLSNEQFIYLDEGEVRSRILDEEQTLSAGSLMYVPAETEHELEVVGDGDAHLYVVRPTLDANLSEEDRSDLNAELKSTVLKAGDGTYHFDLTAYQQKDSGSKYATTKGLVVEGDLIQVGKMRMDPGTGADPHTHANEQFNYTLAGEGRWTIGDADEELAGPGTVVHIPSEAVHSGYATEDGALHFIAAKDKSYRMYGDPVDE